MGIHSSYESTTVKEARAKMLMRPSCLLSAIVGGTQSDRRGGGQTSYSCRGVASCIQAACKMTKWRLCSMYYSPSLTFFVTSGKVISRSITSGFDYDKTSSAAPVLCSRSLESAQPARSSPLCPTSLVAPAVKYRKSAETVQRSRNCLNGDGIK